MSWYYELVGYNGEIESYSKHYDNEIDIDYKNKEVVMRYDSSYRFKLDFNEISELYKIINAKSEEEKLKDKIRKFAESIVDDNLYEMNCCYDVNGTEIRKELEELLNE